ncbi:MAG: hypothetical protein GF333_05510 [Candidatus Omnitrophica bacterium]|nr:hypothetical protein [Candidatus Omnitrophota bacterium]
MMKAPKKKVRVRIVCTDQSGIEGYVHVDEGLRLMDFLNLSNRKFMVITDAQAQNLGNVKSFRLASELTKTHQALALNKSAIKWIAEIK